MQEQSKARKAMSDPAWMDANYINELHADIERLRAALNDALPVVCRNAIIDECARVAEDRRWGVHTPLETIAAAIRALKSNTGG